MGWTGSVSDQEIGQGSGACWSANGAQMSLRLEFSSGSWRIFSYSDLVAIDFTGRFLKLYFHHCTVTCRGRNLQKVAEKLQENGVKSLREKHANEYRVEEEETYVEEIGIGPPNLEVLGRKPM